MFRKKLVVSFFCFALAVLPSSAQEQAIQADTLVDSVGVNTHLAYTNTNYFQKYQQVISALKAAGIRHIRDGYYNWPTGNQMYTIHWGIAAAGIHTEYVVAYDPLLTTADLQNFQSLARDMESIEGPNEYDDQKNSQWATQLTSFLPTLQLAGAALNVPVLGPSLTQQASYSALGNIVPYITYNNLHIYFGGRNPGTNGWGSTNAQGHSYGSIAWWLDNANTNAPGVPAIVTESGYMQAPTTTKPYTVTNAVASAYTIQTIFEMMTQGILRTYMYELMDDPSSPMYGLMTSTLSAKPSYTSIKSLTNYLSDPGAPFTPGRLTYSLTGTTANVHHLLLQKRDGSFYLALWLNASIYNPATNAPISVPPQTVHLTLDSAHGVQSCFWVDQNGAPHTMNENLTYAFSLNVTPTVTLVKVISTN
ncbi:hypothetical protein H7849_15830 [Alloacidobacterium dinghuense]|uniref:Glycosyl hydrolase catalytic core n=1 Tax=Alloacidobacterium dinghuense TaxID=2763107 RepID=A0A7G8BDI3_9BACT|nr:hypothetical protein [Alloacidobacterium dinghuense]QNI30603.1 hypothetical protein H7849_15830 [Alloacidobacterium dinghuense]